MLSIPALFIAVISGGGREDVRGQARGAAY
jgi:hypothetical protein